MQRLKRKKKSSHHRFRRRVSVPSNDIIPYICLRSFVPLCISLFYSTVQIDRNNKWERRAIGWKNEKTATRRRDLQILDYLSHLAVYCSCILFLAGNTNHSPGFCDSGDFFVTYLTRLSFVNFLSTFFLHSQCLFYLSVSNSICNVVWDWRRRSWWKFLLRNRKIYRRNGASAGIDYLRDSLINIWYCTRTNHIAIKLEKHVW